MQTSLRVQGLDEVMDWPAVSEPAHPGYQRIWEDMQATRDNRGVIDGHGSGLTDLDRINAFAASGLTSDHGRASPKRRGRSCSEGSSCSCATTPPRRPFRCS